MRKWWDMFLGRALARNPAAAHLDHGGATARSGGGLAAVLRSHRVSRNGTAGAAEVGARTPEYCTPVTYFRVMGNATVTASV